MLFHFRYYLGGLILILLSTGATFVWLQPQAATQPRLAPFNHKIVARGRTIYAKYCASCHGANLEGQPNWRQRDGEGYLPAPPHDESGHTWHHADKQLFELTKIGLKSMLGDENFKTRMPAYNEVLNDDEIVAVLSYIKSRWPREIQTRHDKLNESIQRR